MLDVWELSNEKLIEELAIDDDINILKYEEIKDELQKRLHFGIDYMDKYEALGYADFVTEAYFDDTLNKISEENHELYFGFMEYEDLEDLEDPEDLYSYSDIITDGKRVAFLEW